jgi:hypothetical protein
MKTNYVRLKGLFPIAIILLFLTTLNNSCRKDYRDTPPTGQLLISEAQSFFENEVQASKPAGNDNNLRHQLVKSPEWDNAQVRQISIGNAVVVPIKYSEEFPVGYEEDVDRKDLGKTSYLIIYKDKKELMHAEWVTLYRKDEQSKTAKTFVGALVIEDWNGKFKRGYAFGVEGQISSITPSSSTIFRKAAYVRSMICLTIVKGGGTVMDGPPQYWLETYCFSGGGPGGGGQNEDQMPTGDEGGPENTDYTQFYDCNGDLFGSALCNTDCGCIGGQTGIAVCTSVLPAEIKVDSAARDCLDTIAASVISNANNINKCVSDLMSLAGVNASACD